MNKRVWNFSKQFRKQLSEKLMDLGNIVAGAIVVGPIFSKHEFSVITLIIGVIMSSSCYWISYNVSNTN